MDLVIFEQAALNWRITIHELLERDSTEIWLFDVLAQYLEAASKSVPRAENLNIWGM